MKTPEEYYKLGQEAMHKVYGENGYYGMENSVAGLEIAMQDFLKQLPQ